MQLQTDRSMPKFQQTLKSKPLLRITKSINQRLANGIAVAIVQLRIARMEKNNVQELGRKDCTHYGRLAGHWRCNREAFGRGADVAITYTKGADAAASVVKEIERVGRKAIAIQADATDAGA